jgi:hypothetical protein
MTPQLQEKSLFLLPRPQIRTQKVFWAGRKVFWTDIGIKEGWKSSFVVLTLSGLAQLGKAATAIVILGSNGAIISTSAASSAPSTTPGGKLESSSWRPATPCGTPSRLICS